ncbi:MAG: hypothetical protein F4X34_00055 [Chloroflexi bacterium]|nr:hypothetical protein [Chloroflexota bacterium]
MNLDSRTKSDEIPTKWVFISLFAIGLVGIGLMVWLAPITEAEMTPARARLLDAGDWMLKASVGLILGFAGGRLAARN